MWTQSEDFNSDFDKYESYLVRQDESLYLQSKCNSQETMNTIENIFGPFDYKEVNYFLQKLQEDGSQIINGFQKQLIFNLFYKYFGDPVSIKAINNIDYIKLMLAARKMLESYNMVILPYIISSKVVRVPKRKNINKKELLKITSSPLWKQIQDKYRNEKIEEEILGQIGVILSAEFKIIDFYDDSLDGKIIDCISDIVTEEYLMYVLLT